MIHLEKPATQHTKIQNQLKTVLDVSVEKTKDPVESSLVLALASTVGAVLVALNLQHNTALVLPYFNVIFTVDGISGLFVALTAFIFPFCFTAIRSIPEKSRLVFCRYFIAMEFLLFLTFTVTDLFCFYIFFESLLIPMFFLIGIWGARSRKIKAAYYFFLYTLLGSLLMLVGVIYLYFVTGSSNYLVILNFPLDVDQQVFVWFCFFFAFAIKMPMFPFHIWLPEAHVEAPTPASMLLASILLKLGGYGFLRFSIGFLHEGARVFMPMLSVMAVLGVVYGSISTLRQLDMKRVIAYSSVAHMNLVVLGLFSYSQQGIEGAIYLMVAHGVVSAALFFCVGVLYDRYHTRLMRYYGGLVSVMPLFGAALFSFSMANMGFPGTANFVGEILVFAGVFSQNTLTLLLVTPSIVLSAAYSVWLFNRLVFGTLKTTYIRRFSDLNRSEAAVLGVLFTAMIILGLNANFVLDTIHLDVLVGCLL